MAQIAQPQLHISTLRSHRALVLAALGGLLAATAVVTLVIALGSSHSTSISRTQNYAVGRDAGPAVGTPSAIAQAFGSERVRGGTSLTTNVPALPQVDVGPSSGSIAAVAAAVRPPEPGFKLPGSLTTNLPAPPRAEAGPAIGTPTAVRDAVSRR